MKITDRLYEARYWHITRRTQKLIPWAARKLPTRVKYFVVIDGLTTLTDDGASALNQPAGKLLDLWARQEHPA